MLNQFLRSAYIELTIVEMVACDDLCKKQILCLYATKFETHHEATWKHCIYFFFDDFGKMVLKHLETI